VAVRFAFENGDEPNLFNKEGLPASTFRTDDWNIITETATVTSEYNNEKGFIISMEAESGKQIRYTLDGNTPTTHSTLYTEPFSISENGTIKAKVFVEGEPSLLHTETKVVTPGTNIEKHLATGKKVTYANQYYKGFTAGGDLGLVNSIFGTTNYSDGNWQGFQGVDLEVVIDLEKPTNVSEVRVNCLQNTNSWIVLPKQLDVYISEDGKNFSKVASVENEIPVELTKEIIHELNARFESVNTKYIKVIAKHYGPLPDWHSGAGENSWLFVDEIVIE